MKLVIEGELMSSKNSRQIVRNKSKLKKHENQKFFVMKSDPAKLNELDIRTQLRNELNKQIWLRMGKGTHYPYKLLFRIFRKTRRRFDYINMIQNVCDCLVMEGYLPDDDAEHLIPEFAPYELDKQKPRVEIEIRNR